MGRRRSRAAIHLGLSLQNCNGKLFFAHASAATTPTGPAPTMMMRGLFISFISMRDLTEIVKHSILQNTDLLDWRRSVQSAFHESGHRVGDNGSYRGYVPIPQVIELIFLRSA